MSSNDNTPIEQLDDPESGWTWFLSLVSMVIFIVTVVAIVAMYRWFEDGEVQDKVIDVPARQLTELRNEQEALLDEYATYDVVPMGGTEADAETRIRIPVEQAMEVLVAESRDDSADAGSSDSTGRLAGASEAEGR